MEDLGKYLCPFRRSEGWVIARVLEFEVESIIYLRPLTPGGGGAWYGVHAGDYGDGGVGDWR